MGLPEGKKGFPKGKKPRVSFPLGYVPNHAKRSKPSEISALENFKYFWLGFVPSFDDVATRHRRSAGHAHSAGPRRRSDVYRVQMGGVPVLAPHTAARSLPSDAAGVREELQPDSA